VFGSDPEDHRQDRYDERPASAETARRRISSKLSASSDRSSC
jgi:hypothetical protein